MEERGRVEIERQGLPLVETVETTRDLDKHAPTDLKVK